MPVDTKVRVLITADDVLHAWWVPAFGVKQDAIPGFVRDSWFKAEKVGIYRGQCAELCGKEHGFMPIVVEVKSKDDYAKWVAEQKQKVAAAADDPNKVWTMAELDGARRRQVFAANCAACHQAERQGRAARRSRRSTARRSCTGPTEAQIHARAERQAGQRRWRRGSSCPTPTSRRSITYTRNSWGNKTGDAIQPAEVKAGAQVTRTTRAARSRRTR